MPMTKEAHDEACTAYAAMALYDGDAEVSAAQMKVLITATGNTVEPYWPMLFAKFLEGKMDTVMFAVGGGGGRRHGHVRRRGDGRRRLLGGTMCCLSRIPIK
ncbi:hypothetical protein M885DRAFT_175309 [Pelagophyceae sp. CCMP2097]|nr:hypothetical protein M885DRAFT_175309 [Pelagophyceae sp. CCMP2097]